METDFNKHMKKSTNRVKIIEKLTPTVGQLSQNNDTIHICMVRLPQQQRAVKYISLIFNVDVLKCHDNRDGIFMSNQETVLNNWPLENRII